MGVGEHQSTTGNTASTGGRRKPTSLYRGHEDAVGVSWARTLFQLFVEREYIAILNLLCLMHSRLILLPSMPTWRYVSHSAANRILNGQVLLQKQRNKNELPSFS